MRVVDRQAVEEEQRNTEINIRFANWLRQHPEHGDLFDESSMGSGNAKVFIHLHDQGLVFIRGTLAELVITDAIPIYAEKHGEMPTIDKMVAEIDQLKNMGSHVDFISMNRVQKGYITFSDHAEYLTIMRNERLDEIMSKPIAPMSVNTIDNIFI